MKEKKLSPKSLTTQVSARISKLRGYALPVFIVVVGLIYGYLFININNLVSTQPSDEDVNSQYKAAHVPRIDEDVVKQLQALQDNSVSVNTLFSETRTSPFNDSPTQSQ